MVTLICPACSDEDVGVIWPRLLPSANNAARHVRNSLHRDAPDGEAIRNVHDAGRGYAQAQTRVTTTDSKMPVPGPVGMMPDRPEVACSRRRAVAVPVAVADG